MASVGQLLGTNTQSTPSSYDAWKASLGSKGSSPKNAPKKSGGVIDFLNRHVNVPRTFLDAIPKVGETAVRAGAAGLLGLFGYSTPEKRLAFVKEPFTKGGKTLPEHAIDIQTQGEQNLPPNLRPVAKFFGPTTAVGAELAAAFGDPENVALGYGAMPAADSLAEAVLGGSKAATRDLQGPNLLRPAAGRDLRPATVPLTLPEGPAAAESATRATADLPKPSLEGGQASPRPSEPSKPLPTPREAKSAFKRAVKRYTADKAAYDQATASGRQTFIPGTEPVPPVPPKAPEFMNLLAPREKTIIPEPPNSPAFPTDALRSLTAKSKIPVKYQTETITRNLEDTFGKKASAVIDFFVKPMTQNETDRQLFKTAFKDRIAQVARAGGIGKRSKLDLAARDLVEGKLSVEGLRKAFPKQADAVIQLADTGRAAYQDLLSRINSATARFGYAPIPARKNYVTHTEQILSFWERVGNFINGKSDTLPADIAAINVDTKPGRSFLIYSKRRIGGSRSRGLIDSLERYVNPATSQIFHTEDIQRGRAIERFLQRQAVANPNDTRLNNFSSYFHEYVNWIAGKKDIADRPIEKKLGRQFLRVFDWTRKRSGANMVGGSVSAALTNYIPLTQSLATTSKPAAIKGLLEAVFAPFRGDPTMIDGVRSNFLTRRLLENPLMPTAGEKVRAGASALFKMVDTFSSNAVVAGKYWENVAKGLPKDQAMKLADEFAARVMLDRSYGQTQLIFSSKVLAPFIQFQAEVANQLSFLGKDIPKRMGLSKLQAASALTQVAIYSYAFNGLYEKLTGRRPTIDPIHALLTTIQRTEAGRSLTDFVNPADQNTPVGEIVNNLPFASILAGGRIPIGSALPNPFALAAGTSTPTKEAEKALYYLLFPTGGGQLKKSVEGLKTFNAGESTTPAGKHRFYIDQTPSNRLRSLLFGQYATPEARQYFTKQP